MEIDDAYAVGGDANPRPCHHVPLADVDNPVLLNALRIWEDLRGRRRFPSRDVITPRALKPILRNTTLVRVVDGGADYEYRVVGDASVMAHGMSFRGMLWSQTKTVTSGFSEFIKPVYDRVVRDGEPFAMRGWVERTGATRGFIYCEYLFLPLGDEAVDHFLVVAVYHRRDGLAHTTETSSSFRM